MIQHTYPKTWTIAEINVGEFAELLINNKNGNSICFMECRRSDLPEKKGTEMRTFTPDLISDDISDPDTLLIWVPDESLTGSYISAPLKGLLTPSLHGNFLETERIQLRNLLIKTEKTGKIVIKGTDSPENNLIISYEKDGTTVSARKIICRGWTTLPYLCPPSLCRTEEAEKKVTGFPGRRDKLQVIQNPKSTEQLLFLLNEEDSLIRLLAAEKISVCRSFFSQRDEIRAILRHRKDPEPGVVRYLDQKLSSLIDVLGISKDIETLAMIAESGSGEISHKAAVRILGMPCNSADMKVLSDLTEHKDEGISCLAAQKLIQEKSLSELLVLFSDPDRYSRQNWSILIREVKRHCPKEVTYLLGDVLLDGQYNMKNGEEISLKYIRFIGEIGHPDGYKYIEGYLMEVDSGKEDFGVIFQAMVRTGPGNCEHLHDYIFPVLESKRESEEVKREILLSLAELNEIFEIDRLHPFLESKDPDTLKAVLKVIASCGSSPDVEKTAPLIGHKSPEIRFAALSALKELYNRGLERISVSPVDAEENLNYMEEVFRDNSAEICKNAFALAYTECRFVRERVIEILRDFQAQFLIDHCMEVLKSADPDSSWLPVRILSGMSYSSTSDRAGYFGNRDICEHMEKYPIYSDIIGINRKYLWERIQAVFSDKNPDMKMDMVKVINGSDDPDKETTLKQLLKGEKDKRVQASLRRTLKAMEDDRISWNHYPKGTYRCDDWQSIPRFNHATDTKPSEDDGGCEILPSGKTVRVQNRSRRLRRFSSGNIR
ncbi:HEAT repeat domain-containing protein [Methanoplanus limicola]|uniref:HEAT repeat domain-containing protein n=1 Tax=Methanoplanus limicola DSM 2279 TaxID=937775 RepID=H1Z090_9EURY|nr:HEAT repeat domain-containing protein [Methanoplanus limicola]EHQ36182.1 hypothetical protein Metlim_2100 [Methanoplanus limicola DSM 2279]